MKKGEEIMKCLKIEEDRGWYTLDDKEWKEIDKINRDDLMKLLDLAISNDSFEMDEFNEEKLANQAHSIIYNNIYIKFRELLNNKTRFKDESESMYREAIDKYSPKIQQE